MHKITGPTEGPINSESVSRAELNSGNSDTEERAEKVISGSGNVRRPLLVELSDTRALRKNYGYDSEPSGLANFTNEIRYGLLPAITVFLELIIRRYF